MKVLPSPRCENCLNTAHLAWKLVRQDSDDQEANKLAGTSKGDCINESADKDQNAEGKDQRCRLLLNKLSLIAFAI